MLLRRREEPLIAGGNAEFKGPWSDDPVLAAYRFCNVFREDDKTTVWFRQHVRRHVERWPGRDVVACTGFRWFNKIETAERIKWMLADGDWRSDFVREQLAGISPLVTGAYMIKTPTGMNKLDGINWCMEQLLASDIVTRLVRGPDKTLEEAHAILTEAPFLGDFMAYEVVSDLRWTNLLCRASDIMTWANPGPGCARGLGWILWRDPARYDRHNAADRAGLIEGMQKLLEFSQDADNWPTEWPRWEMREVEHWLCEYDKWCRATYNGQTLKRRYAAAA